MGSVPIGTKWAGSASVRCGLDVVVVVACHAISVRCVVRKSGVCVPSAVFRVLVWYLRVPWGYLAASKGYCPPSSLRQTVAS